MSRKTKFKDGDISRRGFIKLLSAVTAGAITMPDKSEAFSLDVFLQRHFKELTDEDKKRSWPGWKKTTTKNTTGKISPLVPAKPNPVCDSDTP